MERGRNSTETESQSADAAKQTAAVFPLKSLENAAEMEVVRGGVEPPIFKDKY